MYETHVSSRQLSELAIEEFETITEGGLIIYLPTAEELGWVDFIGDRYEVSRVLWNGMTAQYNEWGEEYTVIVIDPSEIAEALAADGVDRAPCLSEDTQLARLVWYIGPE